jgi:hypothetical protein
MFCYLVVTELKLIFNEIKFAIKIKALASCRGWGGEDGSGDYRVPIALD